MNKADLEMRRMRDYDIPYLLKIEYYSFEYPYEKKDFLRFIRSKRTRCRVVEYESRIVGYIIYREDEYRVHLESLAVHPDFLGKKIGTWLIDVLKQVLVDCDCWMISAEVNEMNLSAQLFLKSCGFTADTILKGHYDEVPDDCYLFHYRRVKDEPGEADMAECSDGVSEID